MKMHRNAVLVTLDYPPDHGGVARYLSQLVKASEGKLRVIAPLDSQAADEKNVYRKKLLRKTWPCWSPLIWICRTRGQATVVLTSHVFPVGTAAWLSKLMGGPDYAVIFHGLDIKLAKSVWKRWLLRRIAYRAYALFVNSEMTKGLLKDAAPRVRHVFVITPGVEKVQLPSRAEARAALGLEERRPLALTVTRLVPRKGIDISLQAVANLQRKMDFEYCILGSGPDRERLRGLAQVTGAKVRWIEGADDATKWRWMAAADVFLMPTREEADDVEGFGIVYLEAALAGVPSIAGKSGGAPEAVLDKKTGVLVDPGSVVEVEAALYDLLEHRESAEWLGLKAKQRVMEKFQWPERWEEIARAIDLKL
ncbi:MAG: glycosyltransferase family 4 protein [Patescibacteria group bacterium]